MASQQVYTALGRACTKHTEHLAHFDLRVEHGEENEAGVISDLKFKLAFRHVSLVSASPGDPLWFMIDSVFHESCESVSISPHDFDASKIGISLKRQSYTSISCAPKPQTKRVRLQPSSPAAMDRLSSGTSSNDLHSVPTMRRDLCDYLRKYFCQSSVKEGVCVGVLDTTARCKHLVYPLPSMLDSSDSQGFSLDTLLTSISNKQQHSSFPHYQRLCLARSLALAVLNYYATPWLRIAWRSEDILFFPERKSHLLRQEPNLNAPYLNMKVIGPNGQTTHGIQASRSLAPNTILFGPGVVLLEIAYSAPLRSLQKPCDLENGTESQYTEFFTARRLVNSIGREMGSSYGTIVKKLLQCDFGCGDDLNNRDLQAGYYRDVVSELERLEQGFRQLQIG